MLQNSISVKNRHRKFINEVVENKIVWGLKSKDGFATSSSNDYVNEKEEPLEIICFWSNRKLASVCGKKYWKEYQPSEIELSVFLENWCVGTYNDNSLIGTNFDWNLFGQENEPLELIIEITTALKERNEELGFKKFKNIDDIANQAKNIMEGEN